MTLVIDLDNGSEVYIHRAPDTSQKGYWIANDYTMLGTWAGSDLLSTRQMLLRVYALTGKRVTVEQVDAGMRLNENRR